MAKLYRDMTREELEAEMTRLQDEGHRALADERYEELDVLERKYYLAKSYTMPLDSIEIGKTYTVIDTTDRLEVTRMDGVMAWGYRNGVRLEEAYPMAMLV
ncbi:DUF1811 family protein [Tumebacillus flagellatus]|uniref:Uncharacterized protein n=1 Tax=Tumebacillus flagellatus TaxID=1157490 RepID=A0A074LUF8_9BACL|nr:DUF1811 family protein [Tumebacillus flagellatus]KEO83568.1 hypothetical protein EL26_09150 [Tumebacillus flagellatus]